MSYRYASRTIFVIGAPRSGTSWLAKIFDSHPETLYRHEPDIAHRNDAMPYLCSRDDVPRYTGLMQDWLDVLATDRSLRTVGTRPVFAKRFHTPRQTAQRRAIISTLKVAERIPFLRSLANSITLPDNVDLDSSAVKRIVIKSVSSLGRAELLAAAAPEMQFVVIVRHPCGQIASILRGVRWSLLQGEVPTVELADAAPALRRGLTRAMLQAMPFAAQLTWNWVITNEMTLSALEGRTKAVIVRYEDLATDPKATSKRLFAACGLDWAPEVDRFLETSTQATGREGYYQVRRDPLEAANAWRRQLNPAEIDAICKIAGESEIGARFLAAA